LSAIAVVVIPDSIRTDWRMTVLRESALPATPKQTKTVIFARRLLSLSTLDVWQAIYLSCKSYSRHTRGCPTLQKIKITVKEMAQQIEYTWDAGSVENAGKSSHTRATRYEWFSHVKSSICVQQQSHDDERP
jgi:hypothetical protein